MRRGGFPELELRYRGAYIDLANYNSLHSHARDPWLAPTEIGKLAAGLMLSAGTAIGNLSGVTGDCGLLPAGGAL
jgi:hypothetical protein